MLQTRKMRKKIVILLSAILVVFVGFIGTLYYLVLRTASEETPSAGPSKEGVMGLFFKNPETADNSFVQTTTTSSGTTVIQIGGTTVSTETLTSIPTSIVYIKGESPTKVVLVIESVGKTEKGTVLVTFKALTLEATRTTTVNPAGLLALIPPEGSETRPDFVQGNFVNMAPDQIYPGNAVWNVPAGRTSVILQVGEGEGVVFFEFNFNTKTFQQVEIS